MKDRKTISELAEAAEGLPIWGALPGSPASEAGIRYGDILLSANGTKTRDFSDFIEAKRESGGTLEVEILRDSEIVEMTIVLAGDLWRELDEEFARDVAEGEYFAPTQSDEDDEKTN
jgi:S1-C subfamily serine protease